MRFIYLVLILLYTGSTLFAQEGERKPAQFAGSTTLNSSKPVVQELGLLYLHNERESDTLQQKKKSEPILAPYRIEEGVGSKNK